MGIVCKETRGRHRLNFMRTELEAAICVMRAHHNDAAAADDEEDDEVDDVDDDDDDDDGIDDGTEDLDVCVYPRRY